MTPRAASSWRVVVAALTLGLLTAGSLAAHAGAGRRFWHPYLLALTGPRTHEQVLRNIGPTRRPKLEESARELGVAYPPPRLTLVGLKQEKVLEVWASVGNGWKRLRSYAVLAASGTSGPKLREGDLQVPEGLYRLTTFNPNSSYHLSVRVDYPNADDRTVARAENRRNLGGDIYIHGKAVSIGCLALGDPAIEELYVLLADVGLTRAKLILSPSASPRAGPNQPAWIADRYERLRRELQAVRGRQE